jgi:hypothetical protein
LNFLWAHTRRNTPTILTLLVVWVAATPHSTISTALARIAAFKTPFAVAAAYSAIWVTNRRTAGVVSAGSIVWAAGVVNAILIRVAALVAA